eukprot:gb/GEZN01011008.1/.p1 GENE.gb/GEZN01011008.1/~~gb/GEZN01011008.1/.p1  ORF type:complete len:370 (+),score=68.10 gb/GEZN01011008.1/:27-1136(+)
MVLWVDKYRPTRLDKLELHEGINARLARMASDGDFPHLFLFGPSGAGKRTRIRAFLRELYGAGALKIKVSHRSLKISAGRTVEVTTMGSNYHVELNPAEVGHYDRQVVQEVIKEIAQTHNITSVGEKKEEKGEKVEKEEKKRKPTFKVVVITEVDRLSHDAQHALRRTMELYMTTCRVILCGESASRVIGPLRSRCLSLRVPAPSKEEVKAVLQVVAKKEKLILPAQLCDDITNLSQRNVRRAVLIFEACKVEQYPFTPEQKPRLADWERFVEDLGRILCEEQSPARLLLARNKMYELLANCIPADVLIKALSKALLRRVDDQLRHEVIRWAAFYEHRLRTGSKPIFHLEAFVAKFMAIYKAWIIETFK